MQIGIIGGGPAGIAAGVFLKRYNINVVIFEKEELGGLLNNAWRVENIPFIKPTSGEKIVDLMKNYVELYKIDVIKEEVKEIYSNLVVTENFQYKFDEIIVAIGTIPNRIEEFESSRTFYEFRYLPKNIKKLAIYGAGDVAFDGAIKARLSGIDVHIFNKGDRIKALKRLVNIAKSLKICYHENEKIISVACEDSLTLSTIKQKYSFDALLLATGRKVDLSIVKSNSVYLIGDVAHPGQRQASIAVGDGIRVAMEIIQRRLYGENIK
ncbi:MAG: NAD(P)/FAD-dependent oxidoreductase [Thermosipho sp. (in: Bacteria)]|nr:NAD(P)/FAD-dependent oxidoreductase [Thermosipho sp. (in: thermotogales)]